MPSRRTVLKLGAAPFLIGCAPLVRAAAPHVAVIGAGAFGGWTAWWLARRGARVTIVDAWGPGNMRASSGGETRVIRGSYGDRALYTKMAARALRLWREREREWQQPLYVRTGALWMFGADDRFATASVPHMTAEGFQAERPTIDAARRRWPQIDFGPTTWAIHEPESGLLLAYRAVQAVVEAATAAGVEYLQERVGPPPAGRGSLAAVTTASSRAVVAVCTSASISRPRSARRSWRRSTARCRSAPTPPAATRSS